MFPFKTKDQTDKANRVYHRPLLKLVHHRHLGLKLTVSYLFE